MACYQDVIYAVCILGEQVRYESKSQLVPIMGGAHALTQAQRKNLRSQGYKFDDECAFMSSVNKQWGELSCVHWMLLNANAEIIGNAQYRRNWLEPDSGWHDPGVLYVPNAVQFSCSLEQQFYGGHSEFDAPSMTRELAETGEWLFSRDEIDAVWNQASFISCNMARGSNKDYKKFMSTLFSYLFPLWEKHKDLFISINGYDVRAIAFIAERLVTAMVMHHDKVLPGMKIASAPILFIP